VLKADRVVLTDGELFEDVHVIPGDISVVVVLSSGETLDVTRESVKLVAYTDAKSSWMVRTLAMGLLLETFEETQETLIDLELQAQEVSAYMEEMHKEAVGEPESTPTSSQETKSPYE
tara:strand:+ start:1056 stop:1409 length:354 start_codon:yes stop_codon:yes gene_type:complete